MRKVTMRELRVLAEARGLVRVTVEPDAAPGGWSGVAESGKAFNEGGAECYAPTREAVKAGLFAAICFLRLPRERRR